MSEVVDSDVRATILAELVNAKALRAQLIITRKSAAMAGRNGRLPPLIIVRKWGSAARRTKKDEESYRTEGQTFLLRIGVLLQRQQQQQRKTQTNMLYLKGNNLNNLGGHTLI